MLARKAADQSRAPIRSSIAALTWEFRLSHTSTTGPASYVAWQVDPARALYESLRCVPVHVAVYFKQL